MIMYSFFKERTTIAFMCVTIAPPLLIDLHYIYIYTRTVCVYITDITFCAAVPVQF